ncbi:regulatory protein RecX [Cycloclasticus sp. P1]|uniref:regulatory protein RecX n=1 Tax=Cycloclasticus sp. (strain P1) TaxID=385025 RepID=UPI000286AC38|nr:regulatory protein RecX [Cycloclasticus sp. P1]AFT66898.1 Regulatory protein RecX [Cycloclasticus sp. P1]
MLARREHSQLELIQKLTGKGFDEDDIERLLEEFIELNWQSDQRFAESYSRSRVYKGFGPTRIEYELKQRGVEVNIDTVFDEPPDWQALLSELHTKKYGHQPPKDMKERAKRTRFFQHKGYTNEMIRQLFNQLS